MEHENWIVVTFLTLTTLTGVRCASNCTLTPVNNKTFVEFIYPYFSSDSSVRILEYTISVTNVSRRFQLRQQSSRFAFHPEQWYRTQGQGSSQLLLINNFYYGLLKPLLSNSIVQMNVQLEVTPRDCLDNVTGDQLQTLISDYLLQDFYINETAVKNPFKYSDDVEICTAIIVDDDGWGKLAYRCCGYDDNKVHYCNEVKEEDWVWALQALIITMTIILFLYFPSLIPQGYRIYVFTHKPKRTMEFTFVKTRRPGHYMEKVQDKKNQKEGQPVLVNIGQCQGMKHFSNTLKSPECKFDVVYRAGIRSVDFNIGLDRVIVEGGSTVSLFRSLFDSFVRCKIHHSDPLEECCRTPACGERCCTKCPPWQSWFKAVRTILLMLILVGPAVPFFYAMSAENLSYQELDATFAELGLSRTFNFYVGSVFGKVLVSIICFIYVIHIVILVVDGATDRNISRLYSDILGVSEKKDQVTASSGPRSESIVSKICYPIKRFGVLFIPVYLLGIVVIPVAALVYFILNAPMFRVMRQGGVKVLRQMKVLMDRDDTLLLSYDACEIFWFFFSALGVFVVLTIGANFLVNVLVVAIVTFVVEADLLYRVLPVVFILLMYVKQAYSQVGDRYNAFFSMIIKDVRESIDSILARQASECDQVQVSTAYKIDSKKISKNKETDVLIVKTPNQGHYTVVGEMKKSEMDETDMDETDMDETAEPAAKFLVKNSGLRLRLRQLLLFFRKDDILFLSKKFFFQCCLMSCGGAPGVLEENYINATLQFVKIGVFILFVFLVVMAYGSSYYVSPTNHLFITIVSGLVPLVVQNVSAFFSSSSASQATSSYRYEAQLQQTVRSFSQSWDVADIYLDEISSVRRSLSNTSPVHLIIDFSRVNAEEGSHVVGKISANSISPNLSHDFVDGSDAEAQEDMVTQQLNIHSNGRWRPLVGNGQDVETPVALGGERIQLKDRTAMRTYGLKLVYDDDVTSKPERERIDQLDTIHEEREVTHLVNSTPTDKQVAFRDKRNEYKNM